MRVKVIGRVHGSQCHYVCNPRSLVIAQALLPFPAGRVQHTLMNTACTSPPLQNFLEFSSFIIHTSIFMILTLARTMCIGTFLVNVDCQVGNFRRCNIILGGSGWHRSKRPICLQVAKVAIWGGSNVCLVAIGIVCHSQGCACNRSRCPN